MPAVDFWLYYVDGLFLESQYKMPLRKQRLTSELEIPSHTKNL